MGEKPVQESLTSTWKRALRGGGQPPLRSVGRDDSVGALGGQPPRATRLL